MYGTEAEAFQGSEIITIIIAAITDQSGFVGNI